MSKSISDESIYLLQTWKDGVYIFAKNDDQELILLKHAEDKFQLIHKFDDSLQQFQAFSYNKNKHLITLLDKDNRVNVYSFEDGFVTQDINPDHSDGIYLEFDDSGKYLCCFDRKEVYDLWAQDSNKWGSCKIRETQNPEIFKEYNKNDYAFFKINSSKFQILTPGKDFEINFYQNNVDKILFNKLFKKPHREAENKQPSQQTFYPDFEKLTENYQIIKYNIERSLVACVKKRESKIDIFQAVNSKFNLLETLDRHSGIVKYLYFSDNDEKLFSGSNIGKIKVWQKEDNSFKLINTLDKHNDEISNVLADKTTNFLITHDKGDKLILWKKHSYMTTSGKKKQKRLRVVYFDQETIEDCHIPFENLKFRGSKVLFKDQDYDLLFYDFDSFRFGDLNQIRDKLNKKEQILRSLRSTVKKPIERKENEIIAKSEPVTKNKKVKTLRPIDLEIQKEITNFRKNVNSIDSISTDRLIESPIRRRVDEIIRINVGIDFGTSYTKVAYSRTNPRVVRPLIFNHSLTEFENNFIPSLLHFDKNNKLTVGIDAARNMTDPDEGIYNFKMLFVSEIDDQLKKNKSIAHMLQKFNKLTVHLKTVSNHKFRLMVAAFISYVMFESRKKIESELSNRSLDLSFNVCIPVDYVNNNKVLSEFQKIIATAEFIERNHPDKISDLNYIYDVYKNINYEEKKTRVYEIPETIAEVASYTTSRRVKSGLHVIVDFGAGTTDISIINVKNPRNVDQKFSFYSSHIINYGFREVDRLKKLNRTEEIEDYIYELWERSHIAWAHAYDDHLRDDISWKGDKVQIFISGGGSQDKLVSKIFCKPRVNKEKWEEFLHPINPLPVPSDYHDQGIDIPFHRFAIAYGLSNPKPILKVNDYILPRDAKDDTPIIRQKDWVKEADDRIPFRF